MPKLQERDVADRFIFVEPSNIFDESRDRDIYITIRSGPLMSFRQNIKSALQVGKIPFELTHTTVLDNRFRSLLISEGILSGARVGDEVAAQRNYEVASQKLKSDLSDREILGNIANETVALLERHLSYPEFSSSADELLRQVLVMIWGAFEVFISDLIRLCLNTETKLSKLLFDVKPFRDILSGKALVDHLQKHDYDLSCSMGDLLIEYYRLDSLEKIKQVTDVIFPDSDLERLLKSPVIHDLFQCRNLIVHRRSIVDEKFIRTTSHNLAIGEKLPVAVDQINSFLSSIHEITTLMALVASDKIRLV